MIPEKIDSSIFGSFLKDEQEPELPILTAIADWGVDRQIEINLVALDDPPDWNGLLKRAEITFPVLQKRESQISHSIAEELLQLHQRYFPNRWEEDAVALIDEMTLSNVNFSDDGTVELWYAGSKAFNCLDVNLILSEDLLPIEIRFDG
jgi:hypothetical protein